MVTYKSEDKYNTYARKLYHVVPPSSEIPFIEWVKVFEHLILDMQSQNAEVCDINRATDAVIQMIAKGVVTSEEYKMQLVLLPKALYMSPEPNCG